jgi:Mrp family chromosome partitioning ATPase
MAAAPTPSGADSVQLADAAAYQRLALQLHRDLPRGGDLPRMVLLTSANPAPRMASCGLALAQCLAQELLQPVLCVDAHSRVGSASQALGCLAAQGLSDMALDDSLRAADLALATSEPLLRFLPAGAAGLAGTRRSPEQLARAVGTLGEGQDFVVLLGGPVLDDTSALALAPLAGTVLMVAFENETLLADLDQAQRALRACGARAIGLVIGSDGNA